MSDDTKEFLEAYKAWDSSDLKKYQTKITKLANSLDKDVVNDYRVRPLFTAEEIETMAKAITVLRDFKRTVQHGKEVMQREEARQKRNRQEAYRKAEKAIRDTFNLKTAIEKTIFSLCVQRYLEARFIHINNEVKWQVEGHIEHGKTLDFIETRASNYVEGWIRKLADTLIDYKSNSLDLEKQERQFSALFRYINDMHTDDKATLKMLTDHINIMSADNVVKLVKKTRH